MTTDTVYIEHNGNTIKLELEKTRDGKIIIKSKEVWLGDAEGAVPLKETEK